MKKKNKESNRSGSSKFLPWNEQGEQKTECWISNLQLEESKEQRKFFKWFLNIRLLLIITDGGIQEVWNFQYYVPFLQILSLNSWLCFNWVLYKMLEEGTIYQSGAAEAWWAHNPQVRGSKPRSDKRNFFFLRFLMFHQNPSLHCCNFKFQSPSVSKSFCCIHCLYFLISKFNNSSDSIHPSFRKPNSYF